jgi:hypothetical protein
MVACSQTQFVAFSSGNAVSIGSHVGDPSVPERDYAHESLGPEIVSPFLDSHHDLSEAARSHRLPDLLGVGGPIERIAALCEHLGLRFAVGDDVVAAFRFDGLLVFRKTVSSAGLNARYGPVPDRHDAEKLLGSEIVGPLLHSDIGPLPQATRQGAGDLLLVGILPVRLAAFVEENHDGIAGRDNAAGTRDAGCLRLRRIEADQAHGEEHEQQWSQYDDLLFPVHVHSDTIIA